MFESVYEGVEFGRGHLEVVSEAGVTRAEQSSDGCQIPVAEHVCRGEKTSILSDHMSRTPVTSHLLHLASRKDWTCSLPATASHSARRSAYALPASARGSPEWTTRTARFPGRATGSTTWLRQSMSSAQPRRPEIEAELVDDPAGHSCRYVSAS